MNNLSHSIMISSGFDVIDTNYDYFIISKGSEDRSYISCEMLGEKINTKNIILFDSQIDQEGLDELENRKYNSIENILRRKMMTHSTISVENQQLGVVLSKQNIEKESRIVLDISSMNFWELQDIVFFLLKRLGVPVLDIIYTEPDLYKYEIYDITNYGYKEYSIALHYPLNYHSTRTTEKEEIFVAILGFQKNVLKLLKDINEVNDFYSINGFPSFYPKAKDISQVNNHDYLAELSIHNKFSAEANNPFLSYNTLLDIYRKSNKAFMSICPLGSKPMTLGALLFALQYPKQARIVYPYKENVRTKTNGVGCTYLYRITNNNERWR